ncbi:hypothetical protein Gotur_028239 [Gossypium turneri]
MLAQAKTKKDTKKSWWIFSILNQDGGSYR